MKIGYDYWMYKSDVAACHCGNCSPKILYQIGLNGNLPRYCVFCDPSDGGCGKRTQFYPSWDAAVNVWNQD